MLKAQVHTPLDSRQNEAKGDSVGEGVVLDPTIFITV